MPAKARLAPADGAWYSFFTPSRSPRSPGVSRLSSDAVPQSVPPTRDWGKALERTARLSFALAGAVALIALIGVLTGLRPLAVFLPGWPRPIPSTLFVILGTVAAYRLLADKQEKR